MSYILESLKRSDRERDGEQILAPVVEQDAPFLANEVSERPSYLPWLVVIAVLCLLIVSLLVWFIHSRFPIQKPVSASVVPEISTAQSKQSVENINAPSKTPPLSNRESPSMIRGQQKREPESSSDMLKTLDTNQLYEKASQQQATSEITLREIEALYKALDTMQIKDVKTKSKQAQITESQIEKVQVKTVQSSQEKRKINPVTGMPHEGGNAIDRAVPDAVVHHRAALQPEAVFEQSKENLIESINEQSTELNTKNEENNKPLIPSVYNLDPLVKKNIPSVNYGAHIYSANSSSGFVILNGVKRIPGDQLNNGIFIESIADDYVVLSFNGVVFSLPAMKSWSP